MTLPAMLIALGHPSRRRPWDGALMSSRGALLELRPIGDCLLLLFEFFSLYLPFLLLLGEFSPSNSTEPDGSTTVTRSGSAGRVIRSDSQKGQTNAIG